MTLKIEFDTVAVTDAVRQLPNGWARTVSDKHDIIKTAYSHSAIVTHWLSKLLLRNQWEITTSSQSKQYCGFSIVKKKESLTSQGMLFDFEVGR